VHHDALLISHVDTVVKVELSLSNLVGRYASGFLDPTGLRRFLICELAAPRELPVTLALGRRNCAQVKFGTPTRLEA
jgi:hypothetical protein